MLFTHDFFKQKNFSYITNIPKTTKFTINTMHKLCSWFFCDKTASILTHNCSQQLSAQDFHNCIPPKQPVGLVIRLERE